MHSKALYDVLLEMSVGVGVMSGGVIGSSGFGGGFVSAPFPIPSLIVKAK
jgi:hypothetical protein